MAETTKPAVAKTALPKEVFNVEVNNHELLKLAYDSYLANSRLASATTKQRGEVRGGGKKPWKQKGTGRARFGSTRNPIWRGGGIVFGPRGNENYTKKLSTTSKRVAVKQAHTPFTKGYKPQFYFRTTDVTGEVELPADKEMVMPGDTLTFKVKLLAPIAMEQGLNFAIREGGKTVGAGVVTKITK